MKKTKKVSDAFNLAIPEIEKKLGYSFRDKSLLIQAFTRTSYCNEKRGENGERLQSNEVLEFFGDSVLSVAIITLLLNGCTERYAYGIRTRLNEGDFSNIKSKLSDKKKLSELTLSLGLEKHLRLGEGDVKLGISREPSVMEDLFESIVGAIYVDSGMDIPTVVKVIGGLLDVKQYTGATPPIQSAKNSLQEWCADKNRRLPPPTYKTLSEDGPDHKKSYERGCYIGDRLVGRGCGKNLKLADAAAAEDALRNLQGNEAVSKASGADKKTAPKATQQTNGKKSAADASKEAKKCVKAPTASPKTAENATRPQPSGATALLKGYALSHKTPTPSFKDLGLMKGGSGAIEYRIECRFMGSSAIGTANNRIDAREAAANIIVKHLGIGKKPNAKKSSAPKQRTPGRRKQG